MCIQVSESEPHWCNSVLRGLPRVSQEALWGQTEGDLHLLQFLFWCGGFLIHVNPSCLKISSPGLNHKSEEVAFAFHFCEPLL